MEKKVDSSAAIQKVTSFSIADILKNREERREHQKDRCQQEEALDMRRKSMKYRGTSEFNRACNRQVGYRPVPLTVPDPETNKLIKEEIGEELYKKQLMID